MWFDVDNITNLIQQQVQIRSTNVKSVDSDNKKLSIENECSVAIRDLRPLLIGSPSPLKISAEQDTPLHDNKIESINNENFIFKNQIKFPRIPNQNFFVEEVYYSKYEPRITNNIKALQSGGFADIFVDLDTNICYKIFRNKSSTNKEFNIVKLFEEKREEFLSKGIYFDTGRVMKYLECGRINKNIVFSMYRAAYPSDTTKLDVLSQNYISETTIPYVAMEYINGIDAMEYGLTYGYLDETSAASVTLALLLAVDELHKFGFLHRDIKPDNFIITGDIHGHFSITLVDLGLAAPKPAHISQAIVELGAGTKGYLAPEALNEGLHSVSSDLFSAGMSMRVICGDRIDPSSYIMKLLLKMTDINPLYRGTIADSIQYINYNLMKSKKHNSGCSNIKGYKHSQCVQAEKFDRSTKWKSV